MDIISALFVENLDFRQVEGPATRIDMTGVMFSMLAPRPAPVTIEPHLVVLVRCPENETGTAVLETVFRKQGEPGTQGKQDGEQVARNVMPFQVEPGKFGYRLVRGELTYDDYGTIEAHCRLDQGPWHIVPLTLLAPA